MTISLMQRAAPVDDTAERAQSTRAQATRGGAR